MVTPNSDICAGEPHFLSNLPVDCILNRLARLHKSGKRRDDFVGIVMTSAEETFLIVTRSHHDNHDGIDTREGKCAACGVCAVQLVAAETNCIIGSTS